MANENGTPELSSFQENSQSFHHLRESKREGIDCVNDCLRSLVQAKAIIQILRLTTQDDEHTLSPELLNDALWGVQDHLNALDMALADAPHINRAGEYK